MRALLSISRAIDSINELIGRKLAWLIVAAVAISTANAIVRKLFNMSSNAYLEMQWMLFSAVFLLCAPWTLLVKEHIRIDIVNAALPRRLRQWIELIGHTLFLMPFALLTLYYAIPFFLRSYEVNEQSLSAGGLPQWPAKGLVVIGFFLLSLQGVSEIIKQVAVMIGRLDDEEGGGGQAAMAEAETQRLIEQAQADGIAR